MNGSFFRHASVSRTYPCKLVSWLVTWLVGQSVTLSDFQSLVSNVYFQKCIFALGEPSKKFWANLGFCPNEGGGGSRQSQLFIKIAQNLICLGTVHKCDETYST